MITQTNMAFLTRNELHKAMYDIISNMYIARNITLDQKCIDEQFSRMSQLVRDIDTSQWEDYIELKNEAAKEIADYE